MTVACLIGLAQARCHYSAVLACGAMALALGMPAAACAALTNSLDLAPNHAGAIQGLAGFVAALASIVAPSYKLYLITGQVCGVYSGICVCVCVCGVCVGRGWAGGVWCVPIFYQLL